MPGRRPTETIPVEAFLDDVLPPMREIADRLRVIVKRSTKTSTGIVSGWRLEAMR